MSETPLHKYSLLLFTAMGFALRLFYLFQPVRYDEAFTYLTFASQPLTKGLSFWMQQNNHPLNTLFVHVLSKGLANQPWIWRLPDFVAGVLLVPLVYILARKLYNRNAALIAAALMVPASILIDFSTQARGYSLQAFMSGVLVLIVIRLLKKDTVWGWIGFVFVTVLGFYEIATFLYFFPVALAFFAIQAWRKENRRTLYLKCALYTVAAAAITVGLYLPFAIKSGLRNLLSAAESLPWHSFLSTMPAKLKEIGAGFSIRVPLGISLLVLLGFLIAVVMNRRVSKYKVGLPLIFLVWFFVFSFVQRVIPVPRILIPFFLVYLAAASAGLYYLGSVLAGFLQKERGNSGRKPLRASPVVGAVLLVLLVVVLTVYVVVAAAPYQKSEIGKVDISTFTDAPKVTTFLKNRLKPGDLAVGNADFSSAELQYYFEKDGVPTALLYPLFPTPDRPSWQKLGYRSDLNKLKRLFLVSDTRDVEAGSIESPVTVARKAGVDINDFRKVRTVYKTPSTVIEEWVRVKEAAGGSGTLR